MVTAIEDREQVELYRQVVTIPEAASILKCSTEHLHNLARAGRIKTIRLGAAVRITAPEMTRLLTEGCP